MKKYGWLKRVSAVLLAVVLMLGNLSGVTIPVGAETAVFGGLGVKQADPATVNDWEKFYSGLDTSSAGGVWTDKSVFESADAYFDATHEVEAFDMELENPRDFLISLSAIASTKTIVGYSTLPTDTMFVLDVSGSMDDTSNRDARMVEAANKAIGDLLALNKYNRIGVVLYSGTNSDSGASATTLLMPLDRYSTTSTTVLNNQTIPSYIYLSSNDYVNVSNGVRNSNNTRPNRSREVVGATYIQKGIYVGMQELTDPNLDTVITEGFQVGTTRTPIMVLMSDGAPTLATTSYTSFVNRNMGNGQSNSTTDEMSFVTQLTASWAKEKIGEKYGDEVEPLFYTLGLGVGNDSRALGIMDPMNARASSDAKEYWKEFLDAEEGDTIRLDNHNNRSVVKLNDGVNDGKDELPLAQNYVDRYFPAGTSNELSSAFQSIVDTIILQTMYYPTLVEGDVDHSGYLEFRDYIGPNMEVKQVEGVQLGDTLYTGEKFAQLVATGMGTVENPTDAGNELVWSLITRLKLGQIGEATAAQKARDLLTNAWQAGQLAYNVDYDGNVSWSNWVGWYADENDTYLGFWDGDGIDADMVGKAAYAIKSYLVLGDVGEGHRDTDMLYASIQVRSALDAQGNVIEDIVYGKLPASLIPMVEYNVELNSNDPATATEITLKKEGAQAPTRLIYEVGLRSKIDILNMEGTAAEELKTNADGDYIFYTNQWDTAGLEEGNHPNKLHNTYVNFFPSEENERYYYHEDMPIYVVGDNGAYVRYSGEKPAAGDGKTYYRSYVTYTAQENGGTATHTATYEPIPASALANAEPVEGSRNWVINKGTLHLYTARAAVEKTDNPTGTLPYSEYAIVHSDAPEGYHLDGILGNNGLLTIDPPEGIKLTKALDETILDNGQTYTFTVELTQGSHDGATIYMVTEEDGVRSAWQSIDFDRSYTVELAAGDIVWLAGLPEGNQYTITEQIDGEYEVSLITIDGDEADEAVVEIEDDHISHVEFTNSAVFTGDIAISKQVESSFAPHETDAYSFTFDVTVTGADANETYETVLVAADGSESAGRDVIADANGEAVFTVTLSHGQEWIIKELPEGACVEATEDLLPGFTSDQTGDTASADVVVGETNSIAFTNTYSPEGVSPVNVDLYVKKILTGDNRQWEEGDSFTFTLEKHVSKEEHTVIEEVTVDYDDADKIADFASNSSDWFTEVGTYSYRITEKVGDLPGIAYDTAICYFDIVVADDGEGNLYIADVIGRQDVDVAYDANENSWDVTAEFTNVYTSTGAVQISLSVAKDVEDAADTGIDKSGFTFELYDADEDFNVGTAPRATVVTNAEGVAAFRDTVFDAEGTYYFVLREAAGNQPGMDYDTAEYYFTVEVTSNPATSALMATGTVTDEDGNELYSETVEYDPQTGTVPTLAYAAEFTNVYEPAAAEAAISGVKTLTGRDVEDGEFTFELYEAQKDGSGFTMGSKITEVQNDGEGFVFEDLAELTYDKTGYYYYAVKEQVGDKGGVTYDENVYYVTVHVVAENGQGVLTVNSVNVSKEDGVNAALHFTNTYVPAATEAVIEGTKELTGTRMLAANMFQFYLYETQSDFAVSGDPVQTVYNNADGKVLFDLDYNAVGEYYYVLRERIPSNLDANGKLAGVSFDDRTYRVQVTVRDNLAGELVAEVNYLDGDAEFVNDYTPYPTAPVVLGGDKTLSGRVQTAGEFVFDLYETNAKFVPVDNVADDTTSNYAVADGKFAFTFGGLTFDQVGGYRYIIVERNTGDGQVDYDEAVFYVLINVIDNGAGQLVASTTVGNAIDANGTITAPLTSMEFFNVFTHAPAKLTLGGDKVLQDHEWIHNGEKHEFTFELYEANEEFVTSAAAVAVAKNDPANAGNEGKFTFSELTFEEEGTYYYVVKEQLPAGVTAQDPRDDATGIVYDTKEHHITVTVEEDPADPLSLKATYVVDGAEGGISFTNVYTTEGSVLATVSGKKIVQGRMLHADGFSFVLKDASGKEVETVINNGDGTSNEGTFSFQPLVFDKAGTYTYTVEEVEGSVAGITYSKERYTVTIKVDHDGNGKLLEPVVTYTKDGKTEAVMTFTNVYKAAPSEELVLEGTKALTGGILQDNTFTFELYEAAMDAEGKFVAGSKLDEAQNVEGKFAFDGMTYDAAGDYYYVVKEQAGSDSAVTYDDNEFYITVTVEDPGDGKLVARVAQIDRAEHTVGVGINFTNVYTPAPTSVTFTGKKTLSGRTMTDGEFTFELYRTGADHVIPEGTLPVDTAVNENGTFTFDAVELDKVGAYYFVVKEQQGTAAHVTYDATVYNVTVTVSNNAGVLEKSVVYKVGSEEKTEITFANAYNKPDPQPDPIEVELYVEKIVKGYYRHGAEGFRFELLDEDGDVVDTALSDEDGEAVLDAGTFKKSHAGKTYTYYLREVDTDIPGMTYSTREYEVEITIYYDSSTNKLSYELVKDGDVVDEDEPFVFTNIYRAGGDPGDPYDPVEPYEPVSPDTGDEGVGAWIALLTLSALGFAATILALIYRKKLA